MEPQVFPGTYTDDRGTEQISWRVGQVSLGAGPWLRFFTSIRGVELSGDLDNLSADNGHFADLSVLPLDADGYFEKCQLSGDMPCTVEVDGVRRPCPVRFTYDSQRPAETALQLSIDLDGTTFEVWDERFEEGLANLAKALPANTRLISCVTCLYADYSPGGHGMTGIRCHRTAKEQYLAVRSKHDYWSVPVTEEVPETYSCHEYQPRVAGTGYRG